MQVILSQEEYINLRNQLPAVTDLSKFVKKEDVKQAFIEFLQKFYATSTYNPENPYGVREHSLAKREKMEPLANEFMDKLDKKEIV